MDGQAVGVLGNPAQGVDVADVELRVDALAEQVHGQVDDVDVAGALAVAEQRALDPVGAGEQAQFRRRHSRAAVVVRVQADKERVAVPDVSAKPLDLVGVHIGHGDLDGVRQI